MIVYAYTGFQIQSVSPGPSVQSVNKIRPVFKMFLSSVIKCFLRVMPTMKPHIVHMVSRIEYFQEVLEPTNTV